MARPFAGAMSAPGLVKACPANPGRAGGHTSDQIGNVRHLVLDLGEATVFIGANNVRVTAILDVLRLALTRLRGETEIGDAPTGTSVRVCVEESVSLEWPREVEDNSDSYARPSLNDGCRFLNLLI